MKVFLLRAARLFPSSLRTRLLRFGPAARLKGFVDVSDTSLHDEYYDERYYEEEIGETARPSAPFISGYMMARFHPAEVIDVGCGSGEFLDEFHKAGIASHGIELAEAGLRRCRDKGLDAVKLDLTEAPSLPWEADLVYSFEVAEHLKASAAEHFVGLIARAARRTVCFTAAAPGQPGLGHINCQPKSYWINYFQAAGLVYDPEESSRWEEENRSNKLPGWFCHNLMVFHKANAT
jgi:hypothetical protein